MDVILIDYAKDPLHKLYGAYRTCYTTKTPREVWEEIAADTRTPDKAFDTDNEIRRFVKERLKTGHVSPLEQVVFWFGLSGVSRALSHQLVRHRIGISFEQQSQRYVKYKKESQFDFVKPPSIERQDEADAIFESAMKQMSEAYQQLVAQGISAEDARFVLPNAMPTNFQIMVNLAELLHIADLRLCWRAQWEIRKMVGMMRAEVRKKIPELAAVMQPKCGEARSGYCDEDKKSYDACPLSKARPHKQDLFDWYSAVHKKLHNLTEDDIQPQEQK